MTTLSPSLFDQAHVAFIGGGNMASALIAGLIDSGLNPHQIRVLEIQPDARNALIARHGILASMSAEEVLNDANCVVFAVKPQQLAPICRELSSQVAHSMIMSIAAGVRTSDLSRWLNGHRNIVRAMPNTPALVRTGITGVYACDEVDANGRALAQHLLQAVGKVIWVEKERDLDAVTAISGSGPAYVFHFLEGLIAAGHQLGLSPQNAKELAIETLVGAAKLASESEDSPTVLRTKVTSPGGTTQAALEVLAQAKWIEALASAARAADHRAQELGDQLSQS
jgi:pyrroline-5-carboxylate reductase